MSVSVLSYLRNLSLQKQGAGIQTYPCESHVPVKAGNNNGFLLEFIPAKTGAGVTKKPFAKSIESIK